jgi:hypothetical protein
VSLPTQPGDFPGGERPGGERPGGERPGGERPDGAQSAADRPERKQPRLRGFLLLPALLLGVVGVVYTAWYLLPEFVDGGDPGTIPVFLVYLVLGFVAGAVPGIVVGLCALVGLYLAHEIRPGLPAELVAVSLSAGTATAIALLLFLPCYGIDLPWLHILLTALVPAALCRYATR